MDFTPRRFGPFFLLDHVGAGGTAAVYAATHFESTHAPPKLFALKKLHHELCKEPAFIERMLREAKLASFLRHINIVEILDADAAETDFFLLMEWVNGISLDKLLHIARSKRIQVPESALMAIFVQVAEALRYAHQATDSARRPLDVVHQDITPQNILVGYDGTVKLTDFGIATAAAQTKSFLTRARLGKMPYMSPEQLRGSPIDQRSDFFSLGVVFYEAWTLTRPFEAPTAVELQQQILERDPNWGVFRFRDQPSLLSLCRACLMKDPASRPRSANQILTALGRPDIEESVASLRHFLKTHDLEGQEARERRIALGLSFLDEERHRASAQAANAPSNGLNSDEPTEGSGVDAGSLDETRVQFKKLEQVSQVEIKKMPVPVVIEHKAVDEIHTTPAPFVFDRTPRPSRADAFLPAEGESSPLELAAPSQKPEFSPSPSFSPAPLKRKRFPVSRALAFLSGCSLLIVMAIVTKNYWPRATDKSWIGSIVAIELVISAEVNSEEDQHSPALKMWKNELARKEFWEKPMQQFFKDEYRRQTGKKMESFQITSSGPKIGAPPVAWAGTLWNPLSAFTELSRFVSLQEIAPADKKAARVFVHLYWQTEKDRLRYPLDYDGKRPDRVGLVFLPLLLKENEESRIRLAHEIGHVLGATDNYSRLGQALFPDGFVEPNRTPLYPQRFGELMTRGIPDSETSFKPFSILQSVRIGKKTAEEIGWVR